MTVLFKPLTFMSAFNPHNNSKYVSTNIIITDGKTEAQRDPEGHLINGRFRI